MRDLDLTFVNMVKEKNELHKRNERAREYSDSISEGKFGIVLDFSEVVEYGIAGALMLLCATLLF